MKHSRAHVTLFSRVRRRGFYLNEPFPLNDQSDQQAIPLRFLLARSWSLELLTLLAIIVLVIIVGLAYIRRKERKQQREQLRAGPKRSPRDHVPSQGFIQPLSQSQGEGSHCRDLTDAFADDDIF